jgi:hypothetical protein
METGVTTKQLEQKSRTYMTPIKTNTHILSFCLALVDWLRTPGHLSLAGWASHLIYEL